MNLILTRLLGLLFLVIGLLLILVISTLAGDIVALALAGVGLLLVVVSVVRGIRQLQRR